MGKRETSNTTAGAWDLRHPGCIMRGANGEEIHEFLGMWPLKPDADLVGLANALSREAPFWGGPGKDVLGGDNAAWPDPDGALVRRHQHRVRSHPLLRFAVRQQPGEVLRRLRAQREDNLEKIWGTCIGCPTGPNATARDIVQYVARGQIKTLVCYDAFPSLNLGQIAKDGRLVPEDAEIPARDLLRRRHRSRTRSMRSSPSWPSPTNSCRAAPTSTPTSPTSRSSPTCPSG